MSKLDTLLGMVDSISARSDKLVNTVNESHRLISSIVDLNTSMTKYDTEIEAMSQLATQNNSFLAEFQKLYEKSFFLESNFGFNECFTNDTSFSNLHSEYDFLWSQFQTANQDSGSRDFMNKSMGMKSSPPPMESQIPQEKQVKNILSISNLHLKPLRCKDSKVQKQKSRYRLSEAYTLNPLRAAPIREASEFSTSTNYSSMMSPNLSDHEPGDHSAYFSETSISGSPGSTCGRHGEDLARTPPFSIVEPKADPESFDIFSSPLRLKSLHPDLNEPEQCDSSVIVPSSLDSNFEDFDNFHHFLRRSRINLKETFPAPLERAKSCDSVLTVKRMATPPPESQITNQHKFHNPAEMLSASYKSLSGQATVEDIYYKDFETESKFRALSTKLLASQMKTGHHNENEVTTPKKPPKYDLFRLMNSPLGSPRGFEPPRNAGDQDQSGHNSSNTASFAMEQRRNSVDIFSKSLATSFMNLVGASSSAPLIRATNTSNTKPGVPVNSPPEKIKKLKKNLKNPIAPKNDISFKRLPPIDRQTKSGGGSSLTIGPNKTKIFDHGESSPFKKPTLRRMSQTLLTDALNESLLF